jgi:hypothetical protein
MLLMLEGMIGNKMLILFLSLHVLVFFISIVIGN